MPDEDIYRNFRNASMIVDQSAWQMCGSLPEKGVDFSLFFKKNGVSCHTTLNAVSELTFAGSPQQKLFSGSYISLNDPSTYVFSREDGTLTTSSLDSSGIKLQVHSVCSVDSTSSYSHTKDWSYLSPVDRSLVQCARDLTERCFIFSNDGSLYDQAVFEGISVLRTVKLLSWMLDDNFITRQKATHIFLGWRRDDPKSVPSGKSFKESYREIHKSSAC